MYLENVHASYFVKVYYNTVLFGVIRHAQSLHRSLALPDGASPRGLRLRRIAFVMATGFQPRIRDHSKIEHK